MYFRILPTVSAILGIWQVANAAPTTNSSTCLNFDIGKVTSTPPNFDIGKVTSAAEDDAVGMLGVPEHYRCLYTGVSKGWDIEINSELTNDCGGFLDNLRGRCGVLTNWGCGENAGWYELTFQTTIGCSLYDVTQALQAGGNAGHGIDCKALNLGCKSV